MGSDIRGPRHVPLAIIEYCAAALISGWGIWLILWGPDRALSSPAFADLRASVEAWGDPFAIYGLGGLFLGVFYAIAITVNGRGMVWTPAVRSGACIVATAFLLNLSLSIAAAQPSSTGVYTYAALSFGYFLIFYANLDRLAASLNLIWERIHGKRR